MGSWPVRAIGLLPCEPGVYRFSDRDGAPLYLGRAANLRDRVRSYWSDLRDRRHLEPMVEAIGRVEAAVCLSRHEAAWLERGLLEAQLLPWNRTAGGEEAVAYIRLDERELSAGLSVEPDLSAPVDGVRWFGPYLGGLQARRTVSALRRMYPLEYTALRADGTQRALAAKLGIAPDDRARFAAAIAALLDRDAEAVGSVRTALLLEREQAAASQSYEKAHRAQVELEAIDWIASPQRLALLDPVDVDVHGWADGVLVTFAVRHGRVRRWTQGRMGLAAAESLLGATPPAWRAFAARNAALAAQIER